MEETKLVLIEVLPQQQNPFSWCNQHIGKVFECFWFSSWGCYRIKDHQGRWDDTFQEGYQNFRIVL